MTEIHDSIAPGEAAQPGLEKAAGTMAQFHDISVTFSKLAKAPVELTQHEIHLELVPRGSNNRLIRGWGGRRWLGVENFTLSALVT